VEIIILTAHANISDGVQAMKNGAFDYLKKGDDNNKLIPLVSHAMEKARLQTKLLDLEEKMKRNFGFENIIGNSREIRDAIVLAKKIASSDTTVLLLGETGTGKELFARAIHAGGNKLEGPFVALNCSAFSKSLLESEIFGHKSGAFTGAFRDKKGLVEEADGGTLFLDEIGEMDIELQAKLLRVLETGEFIKVGDTKYTTVDMRIIAATNRNLEDDVKRGKFREDLFYRLNVFSIYIPPLRERKTDIPILAEYFLRIFAQKATHLVDGMCRDFVELLLQHDWRGNIRELKNVIERSVIMCSGSQLTAECLPYEFQVTADEPKTNSSFSLQNVEKIHIQRVLKHTRGNKIEAAKLLHIGLTTLYRKIEEYKLYLEF
jgi:DNA-binding NtrC family response regulator